MSVLLLRHVHAGDRDRWDGDDRLRPASPLGREQADALVQTYADRTVVAVVSSPYVRCVQSVQPLADACSLAVEEADDLAEGAPFDLTARFLEAQRRRARTAGGDVVLCSHGDVIGAIVIDLHHRGVLGAPEPRWQKASTWVLADVPDGSAPAYLPPPPSGRR